MCRTWISGLALALVALAACSLDREPLLPEGPAATAVPGLSGTGGSAGRSGASAAGGASGTGGEAGGAAGVGGAAVPDPDAGPAVEPDAGPGDEPDAGSGDPPDASLPMLPDAGPPTVTFPEGSCPDGYDCLPFLFLGTMCQQGGQLMDCAADSTCPYDATCGTQMDRPACFLSCNLF